MTAIDDLSGGDRTATVAAHGSCSVNDVHAAKLSSNAHADPSPQTVRPDRSDLHCACPLGLRTRHDCRHSARASKFSRPIRVRLSEPNDRGTANVRAVCRDYEGRLPAAGTALSCHPPMGGDVTILSVAARNAITPADMAATQHPSRQPARPRLSSLQLQAADPRLDQCPASARPWVLRGGVQSNDISPSILFPKFLPGAKQRCGHQACAGHYGNADRHPPHRDTTGRPIRRHFDDNIEDATTTLAVTSQSQPRQQERWVRKICRMGPVVRTSETGIPRSACHTRSGRR